MKTPNTKNSNAPQKVLKSIEPAEELTINISKTSSKSDLNSILTGVSAFIDRLGEDAKYCIDFKISRIIEDGDKNGEGDISAN